MYTPKVIFRYAGPLDRDRRELYASKNFGEYPDRETVMAKTEEWQKLWDKLNEDDKIISRLIELFGLTLERDAECYVIGDGFRAMSVPFIVPIMYNKSVRPDDQFIEVVVHELAHNFAASSSYNPQVVTYWNAIRDKYKEESILTQNHVIVYGIVETVLTELFDEEKMRELIKVKQPEYQKAIDIVDEAGPETIIKEFKNLTQV